MNKSIIAVLLFAVLVSGFALGFTMTQKQPANTTTTTNNPVSSPEVNRQTKAPTHSIVVCAANTSTQVVATNTARSYLAITNDSASTIYLGFGIAAVGSKGVRLNANGGSYEITPDYLFTGAIYCIASSSAISNVIEQ